MEGGNMKAKEMIADAFGIYKGSQFLSDVLHNGWGVLSGTLEKRSMYVQRFDKHTFRCEPDVIVETSRKETCYLYKVE